MLVSPTLKWTQQNHSTNAGERFPQKKGGLVRIHSTGPGLHGAHRPVLPAWAAAGPNRRDHGGRVTKAPETINPWFVKPTWLSILYVNTFQANLNKGADSPGFRLGDGVHQRRAERGLGALDALQPRYGPERLRRRRRVQKVDSTTSPAWFSHV